MPTETTRTITEDQRLQAIGLITLAAEVNAEYRRLTIALAGVVGEPADKYGWYGLVDDAISEAGDRPAVQTVTRLLREMGIEVAPESLEDTNE